MLIHLDALIDLNNMGNIILLRKPNTHHHDRVGHQLSSFRVRNVLYLLIIHIPIHISTTTAQQEMFQKKKIKKK